MVDVQTAKATGSDALLPDASGYLNEALGYLSPPPPRLVAVGGLSGTGKTRLARDLAPHLPPVPGAIHIRSDEVRKALFGRAPLEHLPAAAYAPEVGDQVYGAMLDIAGTCLSAGHSVLLDATWLDSDDRGRVEELATGLGVSSAAVWLECPDRHASCAGRGADERRLRRRRGGCEETARKRPRPARLGPDRRFRNARRNRGPGPRLPKDPLRTVNRAVIASG
jgi:predicted kinase